MRPVSYTHLGKGRIECVPPARVREVKHQLDNYRKFKELRQEWVTFGIELCEVMHTQEDDAEPRHFLTTPLGSYRMLMGDLVKYRND